jgi:hypothetical protein
MIAADCAVVARAGGIDFRAAAPESASRQGSSHRLGIQGAAIVMERRDWSVVSMAD